MADFRHIIISVYASSLLVSCMLANVCCADEEKPSESNLPGHMQPLGSHMEPELVRRLDYMLTPQEFYEDFVVPKKPVVFEGLMTGTDVIKNWQSDDYLRSQFGHIVLSIEHGKKENRSGGGFSTNMSNFIDRYNEESMYMADMLPQEMSKEWQLPRFILCGGIMDNLMFANIWFSSGGTKSVIHSDSYHNLHCLVSGQKKFILIEDHYSEIIGPEHATSGFFNIDVEKVNMTAYPNLATVPWHLAVVNAGDCFYLPYLWLHNVNSVGRNLGVNIWWSWIKPSTFQAWDCPHDLSDVPDFSSLGEYGLKPELQLVEALKLLTREDGTVHADEFFKFFDEQAPADELNLQVVKNLMDILKPDCDGVVSDIHNIPDENFRKAYDYLILQTEGGRVSNPHESDLFDDYEQNTDHEWEESETDHMTEEGGGDFEHGRTNRKDEL